MIKRWAYRAGQFFTRCMAREHAIDWNAVRRVLPGPAFRLYQAMPLGDRWHAHRVWRILAERGPCSIDLEQAALLHDVGKSKTRLSLVHRVLIVLIAGVDPQLLARLARNDPHSWRYPFYVHLHHAEIGAWLCAEAGCSPRTVALIRHHEMCPGEAPPAELYPELLLLVEADDRC